MKNIILTMIVAILFVGCAQKTDPIIKIVPIMVDDINNTQGEKVIKQKHYPKPPKKRIRLKKVKDKNFDADYMYPTDTKKKDANKTPISIPKADIGMTKDECITMITQEKFDKYTKMFGSESASIRRCKMLKAKANKGN